MVFECSLQTFRLHSLHCCLIFWSLLCGQTMQRFFWGGPSSARTVFVYQLQLKELQMPGRWGHSNHLGIVLCSAYFAWSISRQVHKECEIGPKRSNLYQVQLEVGVCTRQMHYMSINPGCHRTQQAAILMFCNMLCSGRLFDPAHQHLLWSYYKIQWFLVCHYHLSCHHGA